MCNSSHYKKPNSIIVLLLIQNIFLFSWIGKMLNLHATKKLPSYDSARDLAGVFVDFFKDKVRDICNSFSSTVVSYRKKKIPFFYRA